MLAENWRVVGYDIERHIYGDYRYPAQLVLQDVRTIDGAQFKDASLIVASPPCQEFSYMAMPWKRAKWIARALRGKDPFPHGYTGSRSISELTALFDACFRIQREAIAAAGHFIPLVIENVRGAQPWVGGARWMYGSFALWGDVPALMPIVARRQAMKVGDVMATRQMHAGDDEPKYILDDVRAGKRRVAGGVYDGETGRTTKNDDGSWFNVAHNTTSGKGQNPDGRLDDEGVKARGDWFDYANGPSPMRRVGSHGSNARKAASARIAKIPEALARHIARTYFPR